MKKIKFILLIFLLSILTVSIQAQYSEGGFPLGLQYSKVYSKNKILHLPKVNVDSMKQDDQKKIEKFGVNSRFGFAHKVNFNLNNSGEWQDLPDGNRIWFLTVESKGAYSISPIFSKFFLTEGSKLFIYNEDKSHIIGAFTSKNNNGDSKKIEGFSTELVQGDEIILELFEPQIQKGKNIIEISGIIHDYTNIVHLGATGGQGASLSCNNDINGSKGINWQDQKRGIVKITFTGNAGMGTGVLLNNTFNNKKMYILTAYHVLNDNNPWPFNPVNNNTTTQITYYWNYESNLTLRTTSGTTKIVATNDVPYSIPGDFILLELQTDSPMNLIPPIYPYFNGWNNSGNTPANTTCIHHPQGDIKKISFDFDAPVTWPVQGSSWKVIWDDGIVENGSSGSPLFDENKLVVGQLYGSNIYLTCDNNKDTYYPKLSMNWINTNGRTKYELKNWLDPYYTGVQTLAGFDACLSVNPPVSFTSSTTFPGCRIIVNQSVSVSNGAAAILDSNLETIVNAGVTFNVASGSTLEFK
jgi:hypothetical protein